MFDKMLKILGIINLALIIHVFLFGTVGMTIFKKYYQFEGIIKLIKNFWRG